MRSTLGVASAALATLLAASDTQAQDAQLDVDAARLSLGTDSLQIILVRNGQEQRLGTVWDELTLIGQGDSTYLMRVYRTTNDLFGPHLDTLVATWPGLEGHSQVTYSRLAPARAVKTGSRVEGWRRIEGDSLPLSNLAAAPAQDAAMFDVAVRASDLRIGGDVSTLAYSVAHDTIMTLRAVVAERETLSAGSHVFTVWRVEMDFAGLASTMWIDVNDRRLRKQVIHLAPGMEMTMVSFPN